MITISILSLMVLTILVLLIFIKQKWNILITIIIIPFLIFNIGFVWYSVNKLLGQPYKGLPDESFIILYSKIEKPWIYLLIKEKEKENPFFIKIDWSENNENQLKQQKELQKKGKRMIAKKDLDSNKDNQSDVDNQLKLYEWDYKSAMPKK